MLDKLFLEICNMSFTASYIILFVLIARLLLKKAPKIFSYSLWSVVLFRLLCPFSFESIFSIFSLTGQNTNDIRPFPAELIQLPEVTTVTQCPNSTLVVTALEKPPFEMIFTLIWIIGMLAMLIYSIVAFVKLKRSLIGAAQLKENIYLTDHLSSPFVMGLFKPKIYLPSSLSDSETDFIIAHERCHLRRFDHLTRIIGFATLTVHWFNPLVWLAFIVSGKDMELSCDEAVMTKMNRDIRTEYSQSLLRFGTGKRMLHATPLAFGEGNTKNRVKNVLNYKKPAFWVIVVSVIAIMVVGIGLVANPKNNPLIIPQTDEVTSVHIEQINEDKSLGIIETVDKNQIEVILKTLQNTNKTMQESINDVPNRKDYFQIDINAAKPLRLYLYNDEKQYYIEEPYVGIYKTSRETSVSIASIYTSNGGADLMPTNARRPMLMVDGVLYLDTGKEIPVKTEDITVLGKITSAAVAWEKPTENGQCNFNSGVGAKYAAYEDGMALFLDNKWFFFEKEVTLSAHFPIPQFGTKIWETVNQQQGYEAISLSDVTREQAESYITWLQDNGWTAVADFNQETTIGGLYQNGADFLSLQFAGNSFGIYYSANAPLPNNSLKATIR